MTTINSDVLVRDDTLMCLLSPVGPHPDWQSRLAFLKLAANAELRVYTSALDLIDADGRAIGTFEPAFGLSPGTRLRGPYSERLEDDRRRPPRAVQQRWRLNGMSVAAATTSPGPASPFRVVYLPLQVPVPGDCHIVASIVNHGREPLDIADGMRRAVCRVDGVPFESTAGRVWNGRYLIEPGRATTRCFRLSDFPGAPVGGTHEMSLEMCGLRSEPEVIHWRGEPWRRQPA